MFDGQVFKNKTRVKYIMKFKAHETFAIRKGWLNKGIRNVIINPEVFVSKTENPMDVLGIGSNMVKSLRYWMQATGITAEPNYGHRTQTLTEIGRMIYENDPYFEEIGSLWLVHYNLACNADLATSWYIFFNEFNQNEFTLNDFYSKVRKYVYMIDPDKVPSERAIDDDFKCIINTYVSRFKLHPEKINPEDNIESPLAELDLIELVSVNKGERVFRKNSPNINSIPLLILLAVIVDNAEGKKEIKISSLQKDVCNVGKIYNLDTITLFEALYRLEKMGYIKVIRTAGLDVIRLEMDMSATDCISAYYNNL